ncbi:MAG: DUF1844 domain-containing protein [Deltaproteobacteria bacterium]|nr:DUF1844 domain-containing protein [Deltaproteobacteria bacterium]
MPNEALPTIDFSMLVLSLSQTALVHLGEAAEPDAPEGAPAKRNLPLARQTIDMLGMLQDKTKGNLTGSEERLIDQVLYDLRLRFVELSKEEKR